MVDTIIFPSFIRSDFDCFSGSGMKEEDREFFRFICTDYKYVLELPFS